MPGIRFLLERAYELPPREVLRRAAGLAALRFSAHRQHAASLFASPMDESQVASLFFRDRESLEEHASRLFRGPQAALPLTWRPVRGSSRPDELILRRAAEAIEHRFDLLGSGSLRVTYCLEAPGLAGHTYAHAPGPAAADEQLRQMQALVPGSGENYEPIDWHRDIRSGYRWPDKRWFARLRYGSQPGVDVKVPWELSRMQHIGVLGLAHRLHPDKPEGETAAREFCSQVVDWIAANPVGYGVNWLCPMDVGLRAFNWLIGLALFESAPELSPRFRWLLARSLYAHGRFIAANLEYQREYSGNHYLANVVGLLCIGAAVPEAPESDVWVLWSLQELLSEMGSQVLDDGVNREGSTHYHCFVTEMFCVATAIALRIGEERLARLRNLDSARLPHPIAPALRPPPQRGYRIGACVTFPGWYVERLAQMVECAAAATKADGRIAQIGDHDSGRVYKLSPAGDEAGREDPRDWRCLFALGGRLLARPDIEQLGAAYVLDADLLVGLALPKAMRVAPAWGRDHTSAQPKGPTDRAAGARVFPEAGLAFVRCGPLYLAASCGRVARNYSGAHVHNDLLSFELQWRECDLVVDGGSYVYTALPDLRDAFRATQAHSTLYFGVEQRGWPKNREGLFMVTSDVDETGLSLDGEELTGSCAYTGIRHERRWTWAKDWLHVEDLVSPASSGVFTLNLAPGVGVELLPATAEGRVVVVLTAATARCDLVVDGIGAPKVLDGFFSEGYGKRRDCSRLIAPILSDRIRADYRFSVWALADG